MSSTPYHDREIRRGYASVAAGQTDATLLAAEAGRRLRLLALYALAPSSTSLTVNRKPAGSGVALTGAFTSANGFPTADLAYEPHGWVQTGRGEGLSVTTGAGAAHAVQFVVASLPAPDALYDETATMGELMLENNDPLLLESA